MLTSVPVIPVSLILVIVVFRIWPKNLRKLVIHPCVTRVRLAITRLQTPHVRFMCRQAPIWGNTSYGGSFLALMLDRPEMNDQFVWYTHSPRLCTPRLHTSKHCYWVFSLRTKAESIWLECSGEIFYLRFLNFPLPHLEENVLSL